MDEQNMRYASFVSKANFSRHVRTMDEQRVRRGIWQPKQYVLPCANYGWINEMNVDHVAVATRCCNEKWDEMGSNHVPNMNEWWMKWGWKTNRKKINVLPVYDKLMMSHRVARLDENEQTDDWCLHVRWSNSQIIFAIVLYCRQRGLTYARRLYFWRLSLTSPKTEI